MHLFALIVGILIVFLFYRDFNGFGGWYAKMKGSMGNFFRAGLFTTANINGGQIIHMILWLIAANTLGGYVSGFVFMLVPVVDVAVFLGTIITVVGFELLITAGFAVFGKMMR